MNFEDSFRVESTLVRGWGGSFEDIKTFTAFLAPSPAFHSPYSNILYFPSKSSDDIQPRKDDIQPRKDDIQP